MVRCGSDVDSGDLFGGAMKKFLAVVLVIFFCADAHAQLLPRIFRPRDNYYPSCPGPNCPDNVGPYSPSHPPLNPSVTPDNEPFDDLVVELEKVIPPELRIKNRGGNCAWCSVEDVFVAAGYEQFRGITKHERWKGATWSDVESIVKDSGVDSIIVKNRDYSIFEHARKEGVGVAVFIPGHAVVCLAIEGNTAYMLDNNPDASGKLKVLKWAKSKFDRLWEGLATCPRRKKPKPDAVKPPEVKPVAPAIDNGCKCPKDQLGCKCDNKSINDALTKLTEVATLTNKSVGDLSVKVSTIDQRLVAVEGKLAGDKPATPPPPSAATPDPAIKQIQDELDKLKKNLNGSATLRVTVIPK